MELPKAYSKYGASMGRRSSHGDSSFGGKLRLARVPLDKGGYDSGGAYWGIGTPLFRAWGETEDGESLEWFFRAADREAAKKLVSERYPKAAFFR